MMDHANMAKMYVDLRRMLLEIDAALEGVPDADIKEYDKAITVMKVGAKLMKKQLSRNGYTRLGAVAKLLEEGKPL